MDSRRMNKVLQRNRKAKPKPSETAEPAKKTEYRGIHPVNFYKGYRAATKLRKIDKDWAYVRVNYLALCCEHCPQRTIADRVRKGDLAPHLYKCKGLKQDLNWTQRNHPEDVFYNPTELQARENILKLPLTYIDPENDWLIPVAGVTRDLQVLNNRIKDLTRITAMNMTLVTSNLRRKFCSDMTAGILPKIISDQKRLNEDLMEAMKNTTEQEPQDDKTSDLTGCVEQKEGDDVLHGIGSFQEEESDEELRGFGAELVVDTTPSGAWSAFAGVSNLEKQRLEEFAGILDNAEGNSAVISEQCSTEQNKEDEK